MLYQFATFKQKISLYVLREDNNYLMSEFSITFVFLYYFFFGGFAYRFVLFLFLFLCLFIFILYWPKTVNFPVSQSLTFRSLTVGRVTWFFMVEPRLSEPVGTRRNSPDNQEYEH